MPGTRCVDHLSPRTLRQALAAAAGAFLLALAPGPATAAPLAHAPDELLVGFHAGVSQARIAEIASRHGVASVGRIRAAHEVHQMRVAPATLAAVEAGLREFPEVRFVERNHIHHVTLAANDPSYSQQWHLATIAAPQAWDITTGAPDVVIAVVDTGVDPTHPDLAPKLVAGYNFYDGNTNTADAQGHGTLVAGVAAATGNNGLGVTGVSWASRIMPVRVTDSTGAAYTSTIANGVTWAADHGARVINLSFSSMAGMATITSAAAYARSKGALVVAAAGNCGCTESTAANASIVSVSATDRYDALASFSSRGDYVDLAAPGVSLLTTARGGGYASASGTSVASPVVAGLAALAFAAQPGLTPASVETLLKANADDLGAAGWDPNFGYGRINAYRVVAAAAASATDTVPPTVTVTNPTDGSLVTGSVLVSVTASDGAGVSRVELYVDGALHASAAGPDAQFFWDTTGVVNGAHALVARAVDTSGNAATSAADSVTVENVSDVTPPLVTISSVKVMKNKVTVTVAASDLGSGVARVELSLDAQLAGTCTPSAGACTFSLSSGSMAKGSHVLQAKAYDRAGNSGVSAQVPFVR